MTSRRHTPSSVATQAAITTTAKLEWLEALNASRTISHAAFRLASAVTSFIIQKNGEGSASTDLLADVTGLDIRTVERARKELRDAGWWEWRRTGGANVYRLLFGSPYQAASAARAAAIKAAKDTKAAIRETKNIRETENRPGENGGSVPSQVTGITVKSVTLLGNIGKTVSADTGASRRDAVARPRGRPRRYGVPEWTLQGISKATWHRRRNEERDRAAAEAYAAAPDTISARAVEVLMQGKAKTDARRPLPLDDIDDLLFADDIDPGEFSAEFDDAPPAFSTGGAWRCAAEIPF